MKEKETETETRDNNRDDWEAAARVIDRLFALIYLLIFIVYTAIILGRMMANPMDHVPHGTLAIVHD